MLKTTHLPILPLTAIIYVAAEEQPDDLLSMILFTTNSECCYPFHVQLADAVETPGGSSELVTILNHVGATASIYNPQTAHSNNLSEAS